MNKSLDILLKAEEEYLLANGWIKTDIRKWQSPDGDILFQGRAVQEQRAFDVKKQFGTACA